MTNKSICELHVKYLTQEHAVDLHRDGESLNTSDSGRGEKKQTYESLQQYDVASILCKRPKVKFMHSSNHTEHCRKQLYYLKHTKHDSTSAQRIFNWNTSVPVHKGRSLLASTNYCQDQLQIPQSLSVGTSCLGPLF